MRPTLIDLTQWPPVLWWRGVLESYRTPLLIVLAALAAGLYFWQSHCKSRGKSARPVGWAMFAVALIAGLGLAGAVAKVHSYGLMMALGFLVAIAVARWRARRCGENPETLTSLGMIALVAGVLGARLSFVIEQQLKTGHAPNFFAFTSGGLVYDGGLLLAVLAVLGYAWRKKLPLRRILDIVSVSAMIGLAFGRMGCTLNGCCYGGVVDEQFPLGVHYPYSARPWLAPGAGEHYPPGSSISAVYAQQVYQGRLGDVPPELQAGRNVETGQVYLKQPEELSSPAELAAAHEAHSLAVHPAQIYGIVNALVLAGILWGFFRLRTREGQVFALMFVLYPITRFMLEYIRADNPGMAVTPAQGKSVILLAAGLVMLAVLQKLPASAGPTAAERAGRSPGAAHPGRRPARNGAK